VLDAISSITAVAQPAAGEQFQGLVNKFYGTVGRKTIISAERDTLESLSKFLVARKLGDFGALGTNVSNDPQPTGTTPNWTQHSYYVFWGPFQPGKYKFVLELNRVSDEYPTAVTAFSASIGLTIGVTAETVRDTVRAQGTLVYGETEVVLPPSHAAYISTIANLKTLAFSGVSLNDVQLEQYKRWWNMHNAVAWNGAYQTDLAMYLGKQHKMGFYYTVAPSSVVVCSLQLQGRTTQARKKGKRGKHDLYMLDDLGTDLSGPYPI
jgi:hypothetical protein